MNEPIKPTQKHHGRLQLANAFPWFDRKIHLATKAIEAIHYGLWLGLMDRESLQRVTEAGYQAVPSYMNASYNLQGLVKWEETAIQQFFGNCHSLLLGAAGGGREIVALARLGFQVDAFEPSPTYVKSCIELLENENIHSDVRVSAPDQVPDAFGIYDGLILGWGAYIHTPGRAERVRFLQDFRRHVRPGGPLLLSFFTREAQARQLGWIYHIARFIRRLRGSQEPVELGDSLDRSFVHHFTEEEIRSELEQAGFKCVFYSERHYGHAVGIASELA